MIYQQSYYYFDESLLFSHHLHYLSSHEHPKRLEKDLMNEFFLLLEISEITDTCSKALRKIIGGYYFLIFPAQRMDNLILESDLNFSHFKNRYSLLLLSSLTIILKTLP
jgi:hypothetical protein